MSDETILNKEVGLNFNNYENDKFLETINNIKKFETKNLFSKSFDSEIIYPLSSNYKYTNIPSLNTVLEKEKDISQNYPNIRRITNAIMLGMGFNLNAKGTKLIVEAILFLYENDYTSFQMEQIYKHLGKKYSMRTTGIKSDMNNALNSMLSHSSNKENLYYYFSEHDGRTPNIKYFITLFVYELRRHFPPENYDEKLIKEILYSL